MTLSLRPAHVLDLPAIYAGEQAYIQCWEPDHEDAWRRQFERHLTRWVENFDRMVVASVDAQFAGYCLWMPEQEYAELCTINVSSPYRRFGVGRALLEAYIDAATRQGFTRLRLSVRADNPARYLYEQSGFSCTGRDAHDYLRYECRV